MGWRDDIPLFRGSKMNITESKKAYLIEKRSISSTCHAKVDLYMPKYKYGVVTPGTATPTLESRFSNRDTFQLFSLLSVNLG
jgi:hypothetical protein